MATQLSAQTQGRQTRAAPDPLDPDRPGGRRQPFASGKPGYAAAVNIQAVSALLAALLILAIGASVLLRSRRDRVYSCLLYTSDAADE